MTLPPPRANPILVGHDAAERQLLGLALAGRLPGALLLSGPAGIGKATLAFRLARFLLAGLDKQEDGGFFAATPPVLTCRLARTAPAGASVG